MCHKRIATCIVLTAQKDVTQGVVCLFDTFIFLPEVIGRKIMFGRGKLNKEAKYLKGDLYKTKNEG